MVNGIAGIITPEVFECLYNMGHMDELSIVDGNYNASALSDRVIRLPCADNDLLLGAILKLIPLDEDNEFPLFVFRPDHADSEVPQAWNDYGEIVLGFYRKMGLHELDREDFYKRTRKSYATICTQDLRLYANIILRKGIILGV